MQSRVELLMHSLRLAVLNALLTNLVLRVLCSVRVESEQNLSIAERILLLDTSTLGRRVTLGFSEHRLDFGAVDQTGDVGVGDDIARQEEVLLQS